ALSYNGTPSSQEILSPHFPLSTLEPPPPPPFSSQTHQRPIVYELE
ncbi:1846_t:CDS:1, partial [Gigaspora rosea]